MANRPPLGSEMIGPINRAVFKTWLVRSIPAHLLAWFHGWRFVWLLRRMKQDPETHLLGALVSSGDVAVDVGANGANWTWFLSRAVGQDGRVFAFEADPYYAQATSWAIRHMRLKNVTVFPFGLSNQVGTGWLRTHDDKGRRLSGTGFLDKDQTSDPRNTLVGLVTLDNLVGEHPELMKTRLLKCDVEGHELFVFQGAETVISTARPALVFETGDNKTQEHRARNLWRWLKDRSYEMWAIANDRRLVAVDDRLAHPDAGSDNRIALPTERLKDYQRRLPFRD